MRRAAFSFPRAATTVYHGGAMAPDRSQALILPAMLLSLALAPALAVADAPAAEAPAGPAAAPPPGGQPAPGGVIEVDTEKGVVTLKDLQGRHGDNKITGRGFVGLGTMGRALAENLMDHGHRVGCCWKRWRF